MLREGGRTRRVDADVGCNCRDQSIWVFGGEEGGGESDNVCTIWVHDERYLIWIFQSRSLNIIEITIVLNLD